MLFSESLCMLSFPYKQSSIMHIFSLVAHKVKNLPTMQETWVQFLGREDPWGREWQTTPVFLLGEPHGQRSHI